MRANLLFSQRALLLLMISVFLFSQVLGQDCSNDHTGNIPINDFGNHLFHGIEGGLYLKGSNKMPEAHLNAGIQISKQIIPLDQDGNPSEDGKIGFVSIGMSNCFRFFQNFMRASKMSGKRNESVAMLNCAKGGVDLYSMIAPDSRYWPYVSSVFRKSNLTKEQVQVVWLLQAVHVSKIGENEGVSHIDSIEKYFLKTFVKLKEVFPNLKQIYCSGRDYGGYSSNKGNPEPYAYYTSWGFKKLLLRQIGGDSLLAFEGPHARVPWLSWSNYIWADGATPRQDGFTWLCPEDVVKDGVHPSPKGQAKVSELLLDHFLNHPASSWFRKDGLSRTGFIGEKGDWSVYPNPFSDAFVVQSGGEEPGRIRLIDLNGKIYLNTMLTHSKMSIFIENLPKGVYLIALDNHVQRIVKQ